MDITILLPIAGFVLALCLVVRKNEKQKEQQKEIIKQAIEETKKRDKK